MKQQRQNANEGAEIPQNNVDDFEKSSQKANEMPQPSGSDADDENVGPQNNAKDPEDSEHPTKNSDEDAEQSSQNNEDEDQPDNEDSQETIGNEELRDRLLIVIEHTEEGQNFLRDFLIEAAQQEEENIKAEIEQVKMNSHLYVDTPKEQRFIIIFTRTFNRKVLFTQLFLRNFIKNKILIYLKTLITLYECIFFVSVRGLYKLIAII